MTIHSKPLAALTEEAIEILYRELGVVDTVRFLRQYQEGYGDYTLERREQIEDDNIDDLIDAIKQRRDAQSDSAESQD